MSAEFWSNYYSQGGDFHPVREPEVELLAQHVGPGAGRSALDVGCGTGALAAVLHELGFIVAGVDFAAAAIATARERYPDRDGLDFRVLDVDRGGLSLLSPGGFHLVTCRLSLAFTDLVPVIAAARHLLTPGGSLHVTTPLAERQTAEKRSIGLRAAELDLLRGFGWSRTTEYPLDDLLCLLLTI